MKQGTMVALCGLTSRRDLNGRVGRIVSLATAAEEEKLDDHSSASGALCAAVGCSQRRSSRGGGILRQCSRCLSVAYCSVECQRAHWQLHKPDCIAKEKKKPPSDEKRSSSSDDRRVAVRLCCLDREISVRPSNLVLSCDDEWNCVLGRSLWEYIRTGQCSSPLNQCLSMGERFAEIDVCHTFARGLWEDCFEVPPSNALDQWEDVRSTVLTADGHKLFWFGLDPVCHHFLLEKKDGRYRLHQSYIRNHRGVGYTAGEWSDPANARLVTSNSAAAYAHWGGGRELNDTKVAVLLDIVRDLIRETDELVSEELIQQTPSGVVGKAAMQWACRQLARIGEGISLSPCDPATGRPMWLLSPGHVTVHIGSEVLLTASNARAARVDALLAKLTGHGLHSTALLRMVNYCTWRISTDETGDRMGFTWVGADIARAPLSAEEGVKIVREAREAQLRSARGGT